MRPYSAGGVFMKINGGNNQSGIEITVRDVDVENIKSTIISESRTGSINDGKIFIYHVENVYHARTKEYGEAAI